MADDAPTLEEMAADAAAAFEAATATEVAEHMARYPGDRLEPDEADLQAVAEGREPRPFRGTYEHPVHGELMFEMKLPRAAALAQQSVETDNLLAGLVGPARGATMLLVASIAGLRTLAQLPIISQKEIENAGSDTELRIERIYYDPANDFDESFVTTVWRHCSRWRNAFLKPDALRAVGKGSGATRGSD